MQVHIAQHRRIRRLDRSAAARHMRVGRRHDLAPAVADGGRVQHGPKAAAIERHTRRDRLVAAPTAQQQVGDRADPRGRTRYREPHKRDRDDTGNRGGNHWPAIARREDPGADQQQRDRQQRSARLRQQHRQESQHRPEQESEPPSRPRRIEPDERGEPHDHRRLCRPDRIGHVSARARGALFELEQRHPRRDRHSRQRQQTNPQAVARRSKPRHRSPDQRVERQQREIQAEDHVARLLRAERKRDGDEDKRPECHQPAGVAQFAPSRPVAEPPQNAQHAQQHRHIGEREAADERQHQNGEAEAPNQCAADGFAQRHGCAAGAVPSVRMVAVSTT